MTLSSYTVPITSGLLVPFKTGLKALMKTHTESILIFILRNEDSDIKICNSREDLVKETSEI